MNMLAVKYPGLKKETLNQFRKLVSFTKVTEEGLLPKAFDNRKRER